MRRALIGFFLLTSYLGATATLTVVNALITWADGSNPSGTATITWKGSLNSDRSPVFPGKTTITITNGVVSVSLYPNDVTLPPAGCYTVDYILNAMRVRKYWYVPTSASPITDLKQIEGDLPCTITSGVIVAPSQVQPGPAGQTLVLTSPVSGVPRWDVVQAHGVVAPLVLNPTPGTIQQGFTITQSGPTSGNQNQAINYNEINVVSDGANSGFVANYVKALNVNMHSGYATNMSGPRVGISSNFTLDSPSSPTSSNRDYVALQGVCSINSVDNGTAPTIANARGACYAGNFVAQSGANNLFELAGAEFDVGGTGSFAVRFGLNVVGTYTQQGSVYDAGFVVGASTAPWKNGLLFTHLNSAAPVSTNGCLICTDGVNDTVATGIDMSAYTISGNSINMPGGFKVTGAGDQWAKSLNTVGSAPACSSTGLGTGSCAAYAFSTNSAGAMVLSPTGSPSSTGNVTLTFNGGLGTHDASCTFVYQNGSGGWNAPGQMIIVSSGTAAVVVNWGQTGNLTAGSTYFIRYNCIGE